MPREPAWAAVLGMLHQVAIARSWRSCTDIAACCLLLSKVVAGRIPALLTGTTHLLKFLQLKVCYVMLAILNQVQAESSA